MMIRLATMTSILVLSTSLCVGAQDARSEQGNGGASETFGVVKLNEWRDRYSSMPKPTSAHRAIADIAGVSTNDYTHAGIVQMMSAIAELDTSGVAVQMDKLHGKSPMPASHISQGESAMAREYGVDPAEFTLNQLARMKFASDS